MIPIINPLSWITDFTKSFSLSYHQLKHLSRYLTGLTVSRSKTIMSMSSLFTDNLSNKSMNRFLTEYQWDTNQINIERIQELQKHNETRWSKNGVSIIDDTLVHKTGKHIPNVYKFYDHSENVFITGHSLTTLHYADHKTNYALDYRIYAPKTEPNFKTKIELAQDMISWSVQIGMPAQTFVFDSWYTCDGLIKLIKSLERFYIGSCKSDRLIRIEGNRYISLREYVEKITDYKEFEIKGIKYLVYTKKVHLKSIGDTRLVVSKRGDDILCLVTNRTDHVTKILSDYMLRWKIEDFYKDAKQHLGLEKCQVRNIEGIKKHWHLVFLAHSILKLGVTESIFGKSILHLSIGQKIKQACIGLLEKFVSWILEGKKSIEEVRTVLGDMLIYRQS